MEVHTRFFPQVMQDNEVAYFSHLRGIIESVDEFSVLEITKNPHSYLFRLVPSIPKYNPLLLEELLKLHNILGINLILSKSIKTTGSLVFEIQID
jgi:hypothetical protein